MKLVTSWLAPPQSIGGLDHLGTQAPCVVIYGQLLPGITNVTDRARYYSFYPWLVWSFDRRYPLDDYKRFIEYFRRADCLFTLISERHARITDQDNERHGTAMVGRVQLLKALDNLTSDSPLQLSEYASESSGSRYFKNPMGGLAQYYAGTLAELKLLDSSAKPWIKYTTEFGEPLAQKLDAAVPADLFWKTVEADNVSLRDLDALSAFCPCGLVGSDDECQTLTDLYFDRNDAFDMEGSQRRLSLGLILHLASTLPDAHDLNENIFRACIYSGGLPSEQTWQVPDSMKATLACWAIYERNDLLSIAFQTVLGTALRVLSPQTADDKITYSSVESFAQALSQGEAVSLVEQSLGFDSFDRLVEHLSENTPAIEFWENDAHEFQVAQRMMESWRRHDDTATLLQLSLTLLALLACRDNNLESPYHGIGMSSEMLANYPINLISFRSRVLIWRKMSIAEVIEDLVTWCLNTHLRVALRKLHQTGRSTFRMRPSERGLEVVGDEIPGPAMTTPRFRQAVQILRDIGALTRDVSSPSRATILTSAGQQLMEIACV